MVSEKDSVSVGSDTRDPNEDCKHLAAQSIKIL